MSRPFFYCSELSRRLDEKSYGTASTGDVWLLIEYPSSWSPQAFHDSKLSPSVKNYLGKLIKLIPRARLLFIKQERVVRGGFTVFLVRSLESGPSIVQFKISDYEQLLDLDFAAVAAGTSPGHGAIFDAPLYLVCTHGKRDKCCAKFGYPLFKALRREKRELVWQSSHVGGDRFAANLICFPHGLFYAHVTEETGKLIISEYERGRLSLMEYRGRACYSNQVQAAEFFIRNASGIMGLDELRQLDCERRREGVWRVRFIMPDGERVYAAQVSRTLSEFQSYGTCHAAEEKSVIQYRLDDYHVTGNQTLLRA